MAQTISLEQAAQLAKRGDAEAQYVLSSALFQRQRIEESLHWLQLAAKQGLGPARLSLATLLMDGRHVVRDCNRAVELLQSLAPTNAQANILLAEILGFSTFEVCAVERALVHVAAAARLGDAAAMRQLALLAVCQNRWDLVWPLMAHSARLGDAFASAAFRGRGDSGYQVQPGVPLAPDPGAIDWTALQQALPVLAADIPLPAPQTLCEIPLIRRYVAAIHPLVLDALIHLAAPLVRRSQIVDTATGQVRADPMRTSSNVTLGPRQHDHVLEAIERCISRIAALPALNSEFLQILRYRVGEEFRPHVDYFNDRAAGAYQSLAAGGQRAQTVLIYLNEGYQGGSTSFPALSLDIKGGRGDILHFHNVDSNGHGLPGSLHAGCPVSAGEKWLLSQWIRVQRYPDRVRW